MAKSSAKKITTAQQESLFNTLKARFEKNTQRHKGIEWKTVEARLKSVPDKWSVLADMENSGGEPDVTSFDKKSGVITFTDCAAETPAGRRSLCYDREGLESRKDAPPKGTAMDMAKEIGIELLTEEEYKALQQLGTFDAKTSSWLQTPAAIRKLGGALFGDYRYGTVFIYHNGAQSYYAARGFRGKLIV
jgi:Protein of unknown function (DUF4256)